MSNDPTTQNNSNLAVGTVGAVSAAALALALFGTVFHSGNDVSTQSNVTSRILNGTTAYDVVATAGSTATGGLLSAGTGNYQAITVLSPMAVGNTNGLNSGTGVVNYLQVKMTAPQGLANGTITCSIAATTVRGTGGILLLKRTALTATGNVIVTNLGSGGIVPVIGPNQSIRCSVNPDPSASFTLTPLVKITPI
jgi:hypothetical protein